MSWTQNNSDLKPAGTTTAGKGGKPYTDAIEADLSHYPTWGQCSDAWGTYPSPRARREAELKREGRL